MRLTFFLPTVSQNGRGGNHAVIGLIGDFWNLNDRTKNLINIMY